MEEQEETEKAIKWFNSLEDGIRFEIILDLWKMNKIPCEIKSQENK